MGHAYHPACGCSACCDVELADERRDEYIDQYAPNVAAKLVSAEDFAADKLTDLRDGAARSMLRDLGEFFTKFHNAPDEPDVLASIAVAFYKELLPTIEAAALDQAKDEVAAEFDRDEPQQAAA